LTGTGTITGVRRLAAGLLMLTTTACGPEPPFADATQEAGSGVLRPGEEAENECERAILAQHEHAGGPDEEHLRLVEMTFDACTFDQFAAFNAKVTDEYKYPGRDGRGYVKRTCRSSFEGSLLCETVSP
jgi:hypothetical protein